MRAINIFIITIINTILLIPTNRESFDFFVERLANQRAEPIALGDLSIAHCV
jgi:hypothetical protein